MEIKVGEIYKFDGRGYHRYLAPGLRQPFDYPSRVRVTGVVGNKAWIATRGFAAADVPVRFLSEDK